MAQHALTQIQHVYKIERQCDEAGLSYDERRQTRQELSRPIMQTLEKYNNNMSQVAVALGISRAALYRRLEKYNIQVND